MTGRDSPQRVQENTATMSQVFCVKTIMGNHTKNFLIDFSPSLLMPWRKISSPDLSQVTAAELHDVTSIPVYHGRNFSWCSIPVYN